jgi:hypothetical protein
MHNNSELTYVGAKVARTLELGSPYNVRLMNLHTARRCLIARIEDAKCLGMCTVVLELELRLNRTETRTFLAYLESDAQTRQ